MEEEIGNIAKAKRAIQQEGPFKKGGEIFSLFSMKKSKAIATRHVNETVEAAIRDHLEKNSQFGEEIGISNEDNEIINNVKELVRVSLKSCGWHIPDNILNQIDIKLYAGSTNKPRAETQMKFIKVNNSEFSALSKNRKLRVLIHEILHCISLSKGKFNYDITYSGHDTNVDNISIKRNTGYARDFSKSKNASIPKSLGTGLNEGFTDIVTYYILSRNGFSTSEEKDSYYVKYIKIVDSLILDMSSRVGIKYDKILDYLIQGYLLSDMKYLKVIGHIYGDTFLKDLMMFGTTEEIHGGVDKDSLMKTFNNQLKELTNKYTFLSQDGGFSDEITEYIGDVGR